MQCIDKLKCLKQILAMFQFFTSKISNEFSNTLKHSVDLIGCSWTKIFLQVVRIRGFSIRHCNCTLTKAI